MLQADWWGQFYSDGGEPTVALLQVEAALEEGNSEWSAARRGRVWFMSCQRVEGEVRQKGALAYILLSKTSQ
uniref:Uncharacterized protein n=1 Tax=Oncorhynchus kisutch TaxID=8019 RepID=A0A8C7D824_ONCKI